MKYLMLLALACVAAGPVNPDHALTPGATLDVPLPTLCKRGYASSVRNVTEAEKKVVFDRYKLDYKTHAKYEVDHLISLELGGSNDVTNLWPQPYAAPGAHQKDLVENWLHREVCAGRWKLYEAQTRITVDWYGLYQSMTLAEQKAVTHKR